MIKDVRIYIFQRVLIEITLFSKHVTHSRVLTGEYARTSVDNSIAPALQPSQAPIVEHHVSVSYSIKELGFSHIIIARTLTTHNICLKHITLSILIYAYSLGYILSIKVEFVIRKIMSIYLCCYIGKAGSRSTTS